jgi:hypothetical protein
VERKATVRKCERTLQACRDVAIVSAVAAAAFFVRPVLGGYQAAPLRPAAMGTSASRALARRSVDGRWSSPSTDGMRHCPDGIAR